MKVWNDAVFVVNFFIKCPPHVSTLTCSTCAYSFQRVHQTVGRLGTFKPNFFEKKFWTETFEVGRSDIDVHTYISGIGRGLLRKNPAKIIANSVFFW